LWASITNEPDTTMKRPVMPPPPTWATAKSTSEEGSMM
jgi:hypothetical protein